MGAGRDCPGFTARSRGFVDRMCTRGGLAADSAARRGKVWLPVTGSPRKTTLSHERARPVDSIPTSYGSATNSVVTIFVDDLDAHVAAIAAPGLEPDERLTW
jgi:hypothetical protein